MVPNIINSELDLISSESVKIFRNLVESVKVGVYIADADGNLRFVNQAFVEILGYDSKAEVIGLNLAKELYVNPQEREVFLHCLEKIGFVRDYEVRNIRKDGSIARLSATSHFIRNDKDEIIGVEGVVVDVTEKKILEEKLQVEKEKLEQILTFDEKVNSIKRLDHLIDFIVDQTAKILNAERCSLMLLDESSNELVIKGAKGLISHLIHKMKIKPDESMAWRVVREGSSRLVKNIEYDPLFKRSNHLSYQSRSFICVPLQVNNKVIGILNITEKQPLGNIFDESDLRILETIARQSALAIQNCKQYQELEYLASQDPLTRVGNYRYFLRTLDQEISRAQRFNSALSVVMLDIDDFKKYNDQFGHPEGDRLLVELASLLKNNLRAFDAVCRYGGDEFVLILPGLMAEPAGLAAQKIKNKIEDLPLKQRVSVSMGVASFKNDYDRLTLIQKADAALLQAKRSGKSRITMG